MYQVSLLINGQETVIHTPNPSNEAPHILSLNMKESLSKAELLNIVIPYNNSGYSLIQGLITKVKVYDTRDNSVIFSGRVIPTKNGMSTDGRFDKIVVCEGAMNYLNDSQTRRWNFTNQTPQQILQFLLNKHNEKMDDSRKIYPGIIEVSQPITIDTNYETTLNAIVAKIRNILGGDVRVQERNGLLYLDYLKAQGTNNEVKVELGYNLTELIKEHDPMDIVTRVIPLGYGEGVNQLDIKKVNSGTEYVEDAVAINQYGIIEGIATNKDIQNADTLKIYGLKVLDEKRQPRFAYKISGADLSVLVGHENEKYDLGDTLHTIADVINIDVYSRVIERERDLINSPWDPKLTISTRPITLTDQIIDLKQRNLTLENAPQGNTVIFPLTKAENADSDHPITFDLDIPKETININRVYINLHGRRYRANSKGTAAGGGTTTTTEGGGGVNTSTASGGGVSTTSDLSIGLQNIFVSSWRDAITSRPAPANLGEAYVPIDVTNQNVDLWWLSHTHDMNHRHTLSIASHVHNFIVAAHTHAVTLFNHIHEAIYGIFESTYPKDVTIKVNGNSVQGISLGDGENAFDQYDIDITPYVTIGNNKIEISTSQNGRIDAVVYSQIFIQSK